MSSQDCAFGVLVIMMTAVRSIDYDYGQARYHVVNHTFECHVKEVYGICIELQHIDEQITDSYQKTHQLSLMTTCVFSPNTFAIVYFCQFMESFHPEISPQLSSERKAAAASVFLELQGLLKRLEPFQDGEKYENM